MDDPTRRPGPPTDGAAAHRARRTVLRTALATAAALGTGTLAACGSDGGEGDSSPFTGEQHKGGRVLAVKVDNVTAARPQNGLDRADIVYTEQVEAGLSRILAVFASDLPATVGPVRSARESDIELLRQFGEPALAFSGVQSKLLPTLEAAPLRLLPPGELTDGYERDPGRRVPPQPLSQGAPRRAGRRRRLRAPGHRLPLRFRTRRRPVHRPAHRPLPRGPLHLHLVRRPRPLAGGDGRVPGTCPRWRAARPRHRRDPVRDRAPVPLPRQFRQRHPLHRDRRLRRRPGAAGRHGTAYEAHWSRPSASGGTAFTLADGGDRLPFARGQVWVALVKKS